MDNKTVKSRSFSPQYKISNKKIINAQFILFLTIK